MKKELVCLDWKVMKFGMVVNVNRKLVLGGKMFFGRVELVGKG